MTVAIRAGLVVALAGATVLTGGVSAQQLSIQTTDHLVFGTINSGDTRLVTPDSPSAARWEIGGSLLSLASTVSFVLPTTLARVGGGATMPISFCSTCAHLWSRTCLLNALGIRICLGTHQTNFDPNAGYGQLLSLIRESMVVRLGGTITAAPNQMGGSYTGSVVIQLSGVGL